MPNLMPSPCRYPGCPAIIRDGSGWCIQHRKQEQQRKDRQRGSASARGYDSKWYEYTKWFLQQEGNDHCKIGLPGCTGTARCVDHIQPPKSPSDPLFWDFYNHQAACIHCNSVKGRRNMREIEQKKELYAQKSLF